jgi:outer membrane protein, heavy metal efflux system
MVIATAMLHAQTGLSLADAIRHAQSNHPLVIAAAERVRAAEGQRVQAALRPNPRLTLQSENTRFWGNPGFSYPRDTDNFAYLTQIFEVAGKRPRRVELAEAQTRTAEADRQLTAREIAARVSLAYWNAAAAQALRNLLGQHLETFNRIVEYHRNRVAQGAMAEVDLMRVLLERDRIAVTVTTAEQTANQALISLFREMGRADFAPVPLTDALTGLRDVAQPDLQTVLNQRVELTAARSHIEQARANLLLQQSLWKPDPEVMFGYKRASGFNTLIGAVQLNLPFQNRNQGSVATAGAQMRVAEAELARVEASIRAEVESAWTAYVARRRLLTETLSPMRDRADEIARIALAAYEEGGVDLLRLLDAERARLDALTLYFQALSDYQQSVTQLQIVTGAPL